MQLLNVVEGGSIIQHIADALPEAAPEHSIAARAGVIEAIEGPGGPFVLGVQWHPEMAPNQPDWLLQGFIRHCAAPAPH